MSQNQLLDPRDEDAFDAWYLEHLRSMASVPGIYSAQRFKTSNQGFPGSLAIYSVTSEQAFDTDYYRSVQGMGVMATRVDERRHHVDLFDGVEAPVVNENERLLLVNRALPHDASGIAFTWFECVGRQFSTPYRGLAVVSADRIPRTDSTVALFTPATVRFRGVRSLSVLAEQPSVSADPRFDIGRTQ